MSLQKEICFVIRYKVCWEHLSPFICSELLEVHLQTHTWSSCNMSWF